MSTQNFVQMGTLTEALGTRQGSSKEFIASVRKIHQATTQIRRLTPTECERLMSWPDDWTKWGINDKGERVEISDTQRYRMCGNGVVSNVVTELIKEIL